MNRRLALIVPLCLVLCGTGCSLAIKGGVHRFDNDGLQAARQDSTIEAWEIEGGIYSWLEGKVDLAGSVAIVEPPVTTEFVDLRLTSRYNWRQAKRFSPYLGGGAGYYRWSSRQAITIPDCTSSGDPCILDTEETQASGAFPHIAGGFNIAVAKAIDVVIESRIDFAKKENGVDFGSKQLTVGVRFRMERLKGDKRR